MNNAKAIVASAAMVMVAALGSGGLVAWQQSSVAAPAPATSPEIVVEYVDAPVAPAERFTEAVEPVGLEPVVAQEQFAEDEELDDEYEDSAEYEDGEDDD